MSKAKTVELMSEGSPLTLDKINEIIAKTQDRRIISSVTSIQNATGTEYSVNDSSNVIRIEARTVVSNTNAGFGGAYVAFTSPTAFAQIPIVLCTWGDVAALNSDDAGQGRVNPPILTPRNITREGFTVFGARQLNARVRINYIAIGPAS